MILPRHEQHYPTSVLPRRLEEYVRPNGQPPTMDRRQATLLTGQQVLDTVTRVQARLGLTNVDPRYFVATCFHEAGCLNEWDTEVATPSNPTGFMSVGPYQIGDEEARRYGFALADMLDLDNATSCMVRLAEDNRHAVRVAAGLSADAPDPDYVDRDGVQWAGGAMRAYLAIAHNKGLGFVRLTIKRYGLDWPAYKQRNPLDNIVDHGYGEDCVSGGPRWPNGRASQRLLFLTRPPMTGPDVSTLQADLCVHGVNVLVDGVFGPSTDTAVRSFQRGHGLPDDGKVGEATRAALSAAPPRP